MASIACVEFVKFFVVSRSSEGLRSTYLTAVLGATVSVWGSSSSSSSSGGKQGEGGSDEHGTEALAEKRDADKEHMRENGDEIGAIGLTPGQLSQSSQQHQSNSSGTGALYAGSGEGGLSTAASSSSSSSVVVAAAAVASGGGSGGSGKKRRPSGEKDKDKAKNEGEPTPSGLSDVNAPPAPSSSFTSSSSLNLPTASLSDGTNSAIVGGVESVPLQLANSTSTQPSVGSSGGSGKKKGKK